MNAVSPSPKLSISMVHHDGLTALRDCLRSLAASPPSVPYEIVLVDNVSTDGSVEMVAREFPAIKLLRNEQRQGFGVNQNRAIEASRGEYVLLLNDDTLVPPGALDALCSYLDTHPETAVVGPRLLNPDGTLQQSCYPFPSPFRCLYENLLLTAAFPNHPVFSDLRRWPHDTEREVDFVVGAAMLVRRKVIEETGLLDPSFFMYFEEIDWELRMRKKGWRIALCPEAVITHLGGQSSEGMRDRQFVEFNRGKLRFLRKHYGLIGVLAQRVTIAVGVMLRLPIFLAMYLLRQVSPRHSQNNASGYFVTWLRLLRWWSGLGPHQGLAELTEKSATKRSE
jgi:GT2 family glycosyltransferase